MNIINKIEQEQLKADVTPFNVGDTIKVHTRVIEGGKERIQIFQGIVIAKRGSGINEAFTVRKISYGEGVERVFPLHTPRIAKIEVVNRGKVRRAKLHYLRGRIESVRGHLSNDECSAKLLELIQSGCKKFALCHLSQENNTPSLALQTVFTTLGAAGVVPEKDCIVQAQRRNEVSPALEF